MGKDHGFSGCSPVFQGSQLCTSPASIAPSISCLFSFPTLNSNWIPTHMFCLSCGHGRPLPSPTPISSSLFIAWVMPCTPGGWDKWRGESPPIFKWRCAVGLYMQTICSAQEHTFLPSPLGQLSELFIQFRSLPGTPDS